MYSRHVTINLKPNQREELTQMFERDILPLLQRQKGFTDEIVFLSPDQKSVTAISLWESREAADTYNREIYPQVLKTLARVVEGTPEVRVCEVAFSTLHNIAGTR